MSLYRKYRPQTFAEIIGQEVVSETLLKQLQNGSFTHAYLFSGPRGTGKTSTARIFAKALNCQRFKDGQFGEPCNACENCRAITKGSYMDVIEIDAASNRGIDEIRDLREKVNLSPTVGKYKVYIIDEVHMLTNEAFNALLKTLEEPPEHAIFILATTELHKVPATIQSRTQRFEFVRPTLEHLKTKLAKIPEAMNFSKTSLESISKAAEGSYRDAEVLLEKVFSANPSPKEDEVERILGRKSLSQTLELVSLLLTKNTKEAVLLLEGFVEGGGNVKIFTEGLIDVLRDVLLIKIGVLKKNTKFSAEVFAALESYSQTVPRSKLTKWIGLFTESLLELKDSPIPSLPLELAIVEACEFGENSEFRSQNSEVDGPKAKTEEVTTELVVSKATERPAVKVTAEDVQVIKADKKTAVKDTDLLASWSKVIDKVKEQNNSLSVFLRGATPLGFEDNAVLVEVAYRFHKDRLEEPKNSDIVSAVISEILGRDVRIKGVVGEKKERSKKEDPLEEVDPVEIFGKLS